MVGMLGKRSGGKVKKVGLIYPFLRISRPIILFVPYILANINTSNIQTQCATEWNTLNADKKEQYFQADNEINKCRGLNKTDLIENLSRRKAELNKQIKELRKIVNILLNSGQFSFFLKLLITIFYCFIV